MGNVSVYFKRFMEYNNILKYNMSRKKGDKKSDIFHSIGWMPDIA